MADRAAFSPGKACCECAQVSDSGKKEACEPTRTMRVFVHGRVQGVNFRWFARTMAVRLGIVGYARNMQDADTLEVQAQGTSQQLQAYLVCLRQGPPAARVADITVDWDSDEDDKKYQLFEIRY